MVELEKGRPAKYIRQKKICNPPKPLTEDRWKAFLNNQNKGPGKKQSIGLWLFLLEPRNASIDGGILYLDILDHMKRKFSMSRSRVDTLIGHMEKWQLVKKQIKIVSSEKTVNKNRIFYQICGNAVTPIYTQEGTARDYPRLTRENRELKNDLEFAICFIETQGLSDEYDDEVKKRKLHREKWKNKTRDEINREIRNMTPEEYQEYILNLEHDRKFYFQRDLEKMSETTLPFPSELSAIAHTR
jgi:hypothetical protein